ncbi:hypothetical protein PCASD_10624 [Puccinia coronata f. sp. avenae]|uniref:Uncharacterized protein n=1 Tax=Puccinia coronata f. sp. avenae TaxID=200324 RepID=A0A2N5TE99_9BASI|nr:hypothetical protein PCASD_10624 [Puccinia coronata f. sp. avenae]
MHIWDKDDWYGWELGSLPPRRGPPSESELEVDFEPMFPDLLCPAGTKVLALGLWDNSNPSSSARTAVFDRWSDGHCPTEARANWSDRFVRPVPAGPVRPVPGTDRTGLSDPPAGASVGQCLSDHQSNTAVRAPLELPCSTVEANFSSLTLDTEATLRNQSIYGGASLTLRFAAAANILEWVDAMQEAGYACNWGPPSMFRLYWTMRRGLGSVKLSVLNSDSVAAELDKTQAPEVLLTEARLTCKVQVAGEDIAEATKPSNLHAQHGHRPPCWYCVYVTGHPTVVYKM